MREYFQKYKWTDDIMLDKIEAELKSKKDATFKIVVGHHPIGHVSCGQGSLNKVQPLLKKYGY